MLVLKQFNIKQPVLLLKVLENGFLAVIDNQTTHRLINLTDYTVVGGFKTNIEQERQIGDHVDISTSGKVSGAAIPGSNKAALFSVAKKGVLYKVGRHQGAVESVAIDPGMRYMVTGGEDGKSFAWFVQTSKLAFTLPPHTDYVTAIAFSDNGQWVATGSFDKNVQVMNLATMKDSKKLRGHSSPIVKLVFLPKLRLLSADREGGLIVWDLQTGKVIKRLVKMNDEITALCTSSDGKFLFVGTKLGYISLYELETYELLKQRYMKESESISSLAFIEEGSRLAVGTIQGNVSVYALFGDEDALLIEINKKNYEAVYQAVQENPILVYSRAYVMAETLWEQVVKKAHLLFEKEDVKSAKLLFAPFITIPKKRALVELFSKDAAQYTIFKKHIHDKRYPLAYTLAKQHPSFQNTAAYKQMESTWKKTFFKAQQLVLKKGGEETAKAMLAPYRGISEKTPLIQQLLTETQRYLYFKQLIGKKEFKKLFELVKHHTFLKEFAEYSAVLDYADKLYIKSQQAYQEGDYMDAEQYCTLLVDFPDYSADAVEMLEAIRAQKLFFDALAADNLANAYTYLANYPLLYDSKEGIELENRWREDADAAMKYAAKGNVAGISDVLKPYNSIEAKHVAMATVYEQCYIVQLEQAIKTKKPLAAIEQGIKKYISMFGLDENIALFFERLNDYYESSLDLDKQKKSTISLWKPVMVIPDIMAS